MSQAPPAATKWGRRAAATYDAAYAQRYRDHDEAARDKKTITHFSGWIGHVCGRFDGLIDALDIGCGTGRYFHSLRHVKRLVGIDVSKPMLQAARSPIGGTPGVQSTTLVEADFLTYEFAPGEFDLAYSIGVLAEHAPLDVTVATRVRSWLKPKGRFAFTVVHPSSRSVPRTFKRRVGEWLAPVASGALKDRVRAGLMSGGLYADEQYVREVLAASGFAVESIEPFESDVHLHLLTVARTA